MDFSNKYTENISSSDKKKLQKLIIFQNMLMKDSYNTKFREYLINYMVNDLELKRNKCNLASIDIN